MSQQSITTFEGVSRALDDPKQHDALRAAFGEEEFEEILEIHQRPAVFAARGEAQRMVILPGIMGSVLTDTAGNRGDLWPSAGLVLGTFFQAMELDAGGDKDLLLDVLVQARSLIPFCYYKLFSYFQKKNYIVTQFPFDWRRRIDSSAAALKQHISNFAQPDEKVYLAAHSMGGLVARRYIDLFPEHAKAHVEHLFMLGTPNHGSYAPPMAFSGKHSLVGAIGWALGGAAISRGIVASFPGMYEMFPHQSVFHQAELFTEKFFPEGISAAHLTASNQFHGNLSALDKDRMTVFATPSLKTVVSVQLTDKGEYQFLAANAGDGTVPFRSAYLPGVTTYRSSKGHAWIPREMEVIRAIDDLITTGSCDMTEYQPHFGDVDEMELEVVGPEFPAFNL